MKKLVTLALFVSFGVLAVGCSGETTGTTKTTKVETKMSPPAVTPATPK